MRFGRAAKGVSDARVVPQCCICDVPQEAPIVGERPLWRTRYYDRLWPILLKNSFSGAARNITGPQMRRAFSDVEDHAIFCCAQPGPF